MHTLNQNWRHKEFFKHYHTRSFQNNHAERGKTLHTLRTSPSHFQLQVSPIHASGRSVSTIIPIMPQSVSFHYGLLNSKLLF